MGVNKKKYSAVIQNILGMLPFIFILAMFILHLALSDKTFSQEERRYLVQRPVFQISFLFETFGFIFGKAHAFRTEVKYVPDACEQTDEVIYEGHKQ